MMMMVIMIVVVMVMVMVLSTRWTCKGSLAANLWVVFAADRRRGDRTGTA